MSIFDVFDRISANSSSARGKIEYVIAGLGNPGLEYENTRHNAGFMVMDELAKQLGEDVRQGYVDKLVKNGHPTTENTLASTVRAYVEVKGTTYEVGLELQDYWKYVEEGTKPHWPPPSAILRWITIKPVVPRPDKNGRIPTPAQLAFLISRKISEDGTPATNLLAKTKEGIIPYYIPKIRQALAEDAAGYIRMTWGTVKGTRVSW